MFFEQLTKQMREVLKGKPAPRSCVRIATIDAATQRLAHYAARFALSPDPARSLPERSLHSRYTFAVVSVRVNQTMGVAVSGFVRDTAAKVNGNGNGLENSGRTSRAGQRYHGPRLQAIMSASRGGRPPSLPTALLPALPSPGRKRANGKALLAAFIAGCEVMSRIGVAMATPRRRGFHAPG